MYFLLFHYEENKTRKKTPSEITPDFVDQYTIKLQILLEGKLGKTRIWMVNSETPAYLKIMSKCSNIEQPKYYMNKGTIFH